MSRSREDFTMQRHTEFDALTRYRIGLKVARNLMRKLGRTSIDGREAHDFAMQSLFESYWGKRRVYFDVIDAYRRERGRNGRKGILIRRKFVALPHYLSTTDRPSEGDWQNGWLMTPSEKRVAVLIAAGFTKTETARWLGITQTAVWDTLRRIGKRKGNLEGERQ